METLSSTSPATIKSHIRLLRELSVVSWLLSALLIYLASFLPVFDSSSRTLLDKENKLTDTLLRWDAFHFAHIALHGYVYEHEWAFFPGTPFVMKNTARLLQSLRLGTFSNPATWTAVLRAGALAACCCSSTTTLYDLTLHYLGSPSTALLVSLLSLLPSSPVTLRFAPYSEPFFTYFSYKGMLCCARSQWMCAALFFALAGTFRSTGFMLGGFMLYGLIVGPILDRKVEDIKFFRAIILTAIVFLPFVYHQFSAYLTFCKVATPAPWCSNLSPSIYTYVQSKYWNVGFLRYWTLSQLPNFLMCAPVLALLLWFSSHYIRYAFIPRLSTVTYSSNQSPRPNHYQTSPFLDNSLAPHAIHAFIFTSLLLFASHTQIILRLAASMPLTYWAAAYLLIEKPQWGRWWVGWSVVWGAVSLVLWTTFLPPA